MNEALLGAVD